jgi:two-component system chemotaxis sensor kinase CheA
MSELKVSVGILDEFMLLSGEMTVIRNMINKMVKGLEHKYTGDKELSHLTELLEELHKINGNIQNKITDMRKESIKDVFEDLPKWLENLTAETQKSIFIETRGTDMRVDTSIAGGLSAFVKPLIQYALKTTYKNTSFGKMLLEFRGSGEDILATFIDQTMDNGNSVNRDFLGSWQQDPELAMVIGGLQAIGGGIAVELYKKDAVKWVLRIPMPKSVLITHCLFVKGYSMEIGVPKDNILRIMKVTNDNRNDLLRDLVDAKVLLLDGQILPIINLSEVLKQGAETMVPDDDFNVVILRTTQNIKFALTVDEVIDIEDAVVKQLSGPIKKIGLYLGATFLGEGNLGLIMSVDGFAKNCGIDQIHNQWKNNIEITRLAEENLEKSSMVGKEKDVMLFDLFIEGRYCIFQTDIFRLEDFESAKVQQSGNNWVVPYRDSYLTLIDVTKWIDKGRPFDLSQRLNETRWTTIVVQKGRLYLGLVVKSITDSSKISSEPQEALRKQRGIKGHFLNGDHTVAFVDIPGLLAAIDAAEFDSEEELTIVNSKSA